MGTEAEVRGTHLLVLIGVPAARQRIVLNGGRAPAERRIYVTRKCLTSLSSFYKLMLISGSELGADSVLLDLEPRRKATLSAAGRREW